MKPQTRQTAIGVGGIVVVQTVAIIEGFNGAVFAASLTSIVGLVTPEALDRLPFNSQRGS